jgi:hypothetical protein
MVNINELPAYIGFGRLNPKTISESADRVSADYFFRDKPVHRISHNRVNGSWQFKDIFDDMGGISSSNELKNAVMMHFNYLDCKSNSVFNFVQDKICSRGNIYFENLASMKDEGGVASYFPAGRLVILRVPIFFDEPGRTKVDVLVNKIPYLEIEKRPLLKLHEAYNTSILLSKENGETSVIPVLMIEYIVTLASILDAVDWICNNNLISLDKIFRMIIQDSKSKNQHSLKTFEGVTNEDSTIYTILFKGMDNSKIKFKKFEKKVVESFININE